MADEDDKESLRSLEQQITEVRLPQPERVRSPKRTNEDESSDDDAREHKRQTVALISELSKFTIGAIPATTTVDGDAPVCRNEDIEEIIEELKLVEPQLDYVENEFTEQEVIDGMQTEMKSMKSFDVYDEIPIENCSQEDIDNALDGTWVKRRKTATMGSSLPRKKENLSDDPNVRRHGSILTEIRMLRKYVLCPADHHAHQTFDSCPVHYHSLLTKTCFQAEVFETCIAGPLMLRDRFCALAKKDLHSLINTEGTLPYAYQKPSKSFEGARPTISYMLSWNAKLGQLVGTIVYELLCRSMFGDLQLDRTVQEIMA